MSEAADRLPVVEMDLLLCPPHKRASTPRFLEIGFLIEARTPTHCFPAMQLVLPGLSSSKNHRHSGSNAKPSPGHFPLIHDPSRIEPRFLPSNPILREEKAFVESIFAIQPEFDPLSV